MPLFFEKTGTEECLTTSELSVAHGDPSELHPDRRDHFGECGFCQLAAANYVPTHPGESEEEGEEYLDYDDEPPVLVPEPKAKVVVPESEPSSGSVASEEEEVDLPWWLK